jgi:hypothetical protein
LSGERLIAARDERDRTERKREWAKLQPDRDDRERSLTSTSFVANGVIDKFADAGQKVGETQAAKAGKNRSRIKVDAGSVAFSISHLVAILATHKDELGDELPARELWDELVAMLSEKDLDPREIRTPTGVPISMSFVANDDNERSGQTYASFKAMLTKARKS